MFRYFNKNRFYKILVCNPWKKNLVKTIFVEVFVVIDLLKALTKSYNLMTKSFHRYDETIRCTLDHASFIEAFRLDGLIMSEPLYLEKI